MEKRTTAFLIASMTVMMVWMFLVEPVFFPRPKPAPAAAEDQAEQVEQPEADRNPKAQQEAEQAPQQEPAALAPADKPKQVEQAAAPPQETEQPAPLPLRDDIKLGSPGQGFKLRVVLTNRGAAVRSIESTEYLREKRAGPLKLIDPDVSPDVDSFLLSLIEVVEEAGKRVPSSDLPDLKARNWEVVSETPTEVVFQTTLAELDGLVAVKRFALEPDSYSLSMSVGWQLPAEAKSRKIVYRLETANGLPLEGDWYAVSFREAILGAANGTATQRNAWPAAKIVKTVEEEGEGTVWENREKWIRYGGVDCQYFAVVTVPHQPEGDLWIDSGQTVLIEKYPNPKHSDVSFALTSTEFSVRPGDKDVMHRFTIFAGPKNPDVLASTESTIQEQMQTELGGAQALAVPSPGLDSLINYGWFGPVSRRMVWLLKFFHSVVGNWGLSILMLTVLVRLVLFPLSRKQAVASQKMQQKMQKLAPEIKKLREKHKNDLQKFNQAQWELMKKHGVNPFSQLGGCLPMLIQFPIFIGLYWGLRMAIELRQAPLIPGLGWCSDLSAPDMLLAFPAFLANFFKDWTGILSMLNLGPYLNVLPIVTVAIFLMQQKLFMPPATDENAEQMQKMMTWMMPIFGLLFYKVPSGLCLYFIASSLWGIAERKMKPKAKDETSDAAADRRRKKKDRPMIPARGSR